MVPFGPDIATSSPAVDLDDSSGTGIDVGDGSTDVATWTFSDIPNGTYAVAATWTASLGQATDATYVVHDGLTDGDPIIGGSTVNQETDPGDFNDLGSEWRPIDYVQVTSNSLTVSLSDAVTDRPGLPDTVVADAIRVELLTPSVLVDNKDPFPPGTVDTASFSSTGGTDLGPTPLGQFSSLHEIAGGSGDTATWTSPSGLACGNLPGIDDLDRAGQVRLRGALQHQWRSGDPGEPGPRSG